MSETEGQSPFGRGFIAAAIVIGAVLTCGATLLATGLTTSTEPGAAQNLAPTSKPSTDSTPTFGTTPGPAPESNPGSPPSPGSDPSPGSKSSSGSTPGLGSESSAGTANRCAVPDGNQAIPSNQPPPTDGWEVSRRVVVPRSSAYGPATTDPDGFRRCFAHSPTGAVYAAYNVIAALADQTKTVPTADKLMLPGRDTDALLRQLKAERADSGSEPTQLAGYRVLDASRDRATIMLALPVQTEYMSATITLTWYAGDWRLVPPANGNPVGAPYSQHRDLDGFVPWSGV